MKIPPLRLLFDLKRFDFDSEGTKRRLAQGVQGRFLSTK